MTAHSPSQTPLELLRGCLPQAASGADPSAPIASFGFDSLDTVEFLCAVHEEFGIRLTNDDFPPEQTLAGLLTRIIQQRTAA